MSKSLTTRVCEILNIEYPIVLAGMGGASVPELAAAVSNAGGLGVLGAAACGPSDSHQPLNWLRTGSIRASSDSMVSPPTTMAALYLRCIRRQAGSGHSPRAAPQAILGDPFCGVTAAVAQPLQQPHAIRCARRAADPDLDARPVHALPREAGCI